MSDTVMHGVPTILDGDHPSVPARRHPIYWEQHSPVDTNLNRVEKWIAHYYDKLPDATRIDEAAILVPANYHRRALQGSLIKEGWRDFAQAHDLVFTNPFGTRYFVEYLFLRHPKVPWRIEIMMLDTQGRDAGFSPLHQSLWAPNGRYEQVQRYPIPHLSFKVSWQKDYAKAVDHLRNNGMIHAQTCQSTYGNFGYYIGVDTPRAIYLKPRVNTRDGGPL